MAESKFKIGDEVQLKSGGPSMTVREIKEYKDPSKKTEWFEIVCDWFNNGANKFDQSQFKEEMLVEYKEPPFVI